MIRKSQMCRIRTKDNAEDSEESNVMREKFSSDNGKCLASTLYHLARFVTKREVMCLKNLKVLRFPRQ